MKALSDPRQPSDAFDLEPMPEDLQQAARRDENAAAVFPDGLAVSYRDFASVSEARIVVWSRQARSFVTV